MSRRLDEVVCEIEDPPPCGRCGGPGLLLVRFPHAWVNERGKDVRGMREAVLCPSCDHADPAASAVVALFTVDQRIGHDNLATFHSLAAAWVDSVRDRTVDLDALHAEEEQWRRGEL